jgi:protease-4
MTNDKHPIRTVLIILGIIVVILGAIMIILLTVIGPTSRFSFSDKVGVIPIQGMITESEPILSQLVDFKKDKGIQAIILRIDSPGGGVGPSKEIYREVRRTTKTKRVIVSMGSLAASGGYYIASAADRIVANPGTITGSIGVIMYFFQLQELLGKIGIGMEVMKSGQFKDIGSVHREMSEKDRELLQGLISETQSQFVKAVAEGRNLPIEKVREIADGRILTGAKAKELGLVDLLGNFRDAVELAREVTGIRGDVELVYPSKRRSKLWNMIFGDAVKALLDAAMNRIGTRIEYRWDGLSHSSD